MIDYLSLALGHGLLAVALLRLVMREELDVDPRLQEFADKVDEERAEGTIAGRAARRRKEQGSEQNQERAKDRAKNRAQKGGAS